jgi:hypothetical protein
LIIERPSDKSVFHPRNPSRRRLAEGGSAVTD